MSKIDVTFKDSAEMIKDDIKTLKEHIYIKRRKINSRKVIKKTSKMPYKVHISEINVLAYLQCVAMLKVLTITMLEMIMLSLLPKVPTTIELRL